MTGTGGRQRLLSLLSLLAAIAAVLVIRSLLAAPHPREVSYSEFLDEARSGHLAEVSITEQTLVGRLKKETAGQTGPGAEIVATRLPNLDESALLQELLARKIRISGRIQARSFWVDVLIGWMLPLALVVLVYGFALQRLRRGGAGALTFGKNRAKIFDQSSTNKVTFKDVAGVDEAEAELVEVVDFLKRPEKYRKLGGRLPKGVLLVGPPGTGKTLLAKAVAGEAGVPFFSISGSEFVEMFVGVGAARVRDLFDQAQQKAPCIVFIDELDAIGKSRSAARGLIFSNDEREQTLNQLLAEMDGFDTSKAVIILAATNTPESLDPALLRAGRFDRQVVVDRPDLAGRGAILRVHARGVMLSPEVDLNIIAARTPGMVGADLANIVNEAALLAARRGAEAVTMRDLEEAIDRAMLGLEKRSRVMTEDEKRRVACHEAGHALVALSVPHANPVHRISIIPRSVGALGHTLQLPTQERFLMTQPEIEDQIAVMLGGRTAEAIAFEGIVSTGASDDLERSSELARQMVTRFGMNERLGPMTYGHPLGARFLLTPPMEERNYSERTAEIIDEEARRLIDRTLVRVRSILLERRADLERLAGELVRKETLDRAEIEALLRPSPAREEAVAAALEARSGPA